MMNIPATQKPMAELVEAYFKHWASPKEEDRWAWQEVEDAVSNNPDSGWEITLVLIKNSPSKAALAYVAAGPLENLFVYHGERVIDRIAEEARRNEQVRIALIGVWLDEKEDSIYPQWEALMREFGYLEEGASNPLEED